MNNQITIEEELKEIKIQQLETEIYLLKEIIEAQKSEILELKVKQKIKRKI